MSKWLSFISELMVAKNSDQLGSELTRFLKAELNLKEVLLLVSTSDGRRLTANNSDSLASWSVTDFENPFAHVIHSAKGMNLKAEDLLYWQSDRYLAKLAKQVGMLDLVCILPVTTDLNKADTLLLMCGESSLLESTLSDACFNKLLICFSRQRELLCEVEKKNNNRQLLKETLRGIKQPMGQRRKMRELSSNLVGSSGEMKALREQVVVAASFDLSVLLQGDTGTGKEVVAQAIHSLSPRCNEPFVAINCAAIPENLLESELFGYSKGAFSGAIQSKQGLVAQADKGILFLDEIGDMSLSLQAKLLRLLETRTFRPLGCDKEFVSDFILIAATHVNLLEQVQNKSFRQDLYYRLCQYPINLPSLSSRKEDIKALCRKFINRFNKQHGTNISGIETKALDFLMRYDFPGNVRELKHLIEYCCIHTPDGYKLCARCLSSRIESLQQKYDSNGKDFGRVRDSKTAESLEESLLIGDLKQALNQYEARIIEERLTLFGGNRRKAAESLGIPTRTLSYKCQKLEINTQ